LPKTEDLTQLGICWEAGKLGSWEAADNKTLNSMITTITVKVTTLP
jgi:hypothetical protein